MAIVISAIIVTTLVMLTRSGKKTREREAFNRLSAADKEKVLTEHERKKQEADELITVILPTINND
jgi:hypothetical protein